MDDLAGGSPPPSRTFGAWLDRAVARTGATTASIGRAMWLTGIVSMVALAFAIVWVTVDLRADQDAIDALIALEARIDALGPASTRLLIGPDSRATFEAFRTEVVDVRAAVGELDVDEAVLRPIDLALGNLDAFVAERYDGGLPADGATTLRAATMVDDELHVAMVDLFEAAQADSTIGNANAAVRVGMAGVFLALMSTFVGWLVMRRLTSHSAHLVAVVSQVERGDTTARATLEGRDELARVGTAINAMLDRIDGVEANLRSAQATAEQRSRYLAESQRVAGVGVWYANADGTPATWSREARAILDVERGDGPLEVTAALERLADDSKATVAAAISACLARGEPMGVTVGLRRRDGALRHVRFNAELVREPSGERDYLSGVVTDVTDVVAIQQELDVQRPILDMANRIARLGGWSFDVDTNELSWSDLVYEVHEVPRGTPLDPERGIEFYAPEGRERVRAAFEDAITRGVPYDLKLQIDTARGRRIWVRTTGEAVRDRAGRVVRVQGAFQDIDASTRAELAAHEFDMRLRATLERVSIGFLTVDASWRVTFANQAARTILRCAEDEAVLGRALDEILPSIKGDEAAAMVRRLERDGATVRFEASDAAAGTWLRVEIDPLPDGFAVDVQDVSATHAMIEQLMAQDAELQAELATRRRMLYALPAHVAVLDAAGTVVEVNDAWRAYGRANGATSDQVGRNYLEVVDRAVAAEPEVAPSVADGLRAVLAGDRDSFEFEYACHAPEERRWFRMSASPVLADAGPVGAVVMHVDITERELARQALERAAYEDQATGAHSRDGFLRYLEAYVQGYGWPANGTLAIVEIVDFDGVNDAYGFTVGVELLRAVVGRLDEAAGSGGCVARTGTGAFAVFVPEHGASRALATVLFGSNDGSFQTPFEVSGFTLTVGVEYGFTRLGTQPRSGQVLLREAEVALHESRGADDASLRAYNQSMGTAAIDRVRLTHELSAALTSDQLALHYQPKVDLASGTLLAGEALVRWNHPVRGLVSPGAFIPLAERSGLIVPLGRWVLERAVQDLRRWQDAGLGIVRIAVNVSANQLMAHGFADFVADVLARYAIPGENLTLEVTEGVFASESPTLRAEIEKLHALGVRLSLDDFGTGYSSLAFLKDYPFDEIKIDRAFVSGLPDDRYGLNIVRTVLSIAALKGATVVAEGIERPEQRAALLAAGCAAGQGYLFSFPLTAEDFAWLVETHAVLPVEPDAPEEDAPT